MLRTCLRSACLRTLPQPGVWAASGLLAYSPQVGVWAAFPYYVLGCVFSMVLRNVVRYLLRCVPGRLCGFLLTTYPETMPPRIPVFSHLFVFGMYIVTSSVLSLCFLFSFVRISKRIVERVSLVWGGVLVRECLVVLLEISLWNVELAVVAKV